MRSKTCEEVDGTSYVVRNSQFRKLRFHWCSKKRRSNCQKWIGDERVCVCVRACLRACEEKICM